MRGAGGSLGTLRKSCWLEMPLDAPGPRSRKKKRLAGKVRLKRPLDAAAGKRGLERPLDAAGKRWTLQGGGAGKAIGRCRAALDAAGKRGRLLRGAGGSLGTVRKSWLESTAGNWSLLERPGNATRRDWALQAGVGGF